MVWRLLRREPYYHKLQYSKAPKFDASATGLGATVGALAVVLALSCFGSGGIDLSDLVTVVWYGWLLWLTGRNLLACHRRPLPGVSFLVCGLGQAALHELLAAVGQEARLLRQWLGRWRSR